MALKDAQLNTLKRPNSAGARLRDRRELSGTSSGFGDLWEKKRSVVVILSNCGLKR